MAGVQTWQRLTTVFHSCPLGIRTRFCVLRVEFRRKRYDAARGETEGGGLGM